MPYKVRKDTGRCPKSKPWAVISEGSGETKGCHKTKSKAEDQRKAIEANTDEEKEHGLTVGAHAAIAQAELKHSIQQVAENLKEEQ